MGLDTLPAELYYRIIDYLPDDELQASLLSLTRVCPYSPIPIDKIFKRVNLVQPHQIVALYRRLRSPVNPCADFIIELTVHCWNGDAEIVLNALPLLPNLLRLSIWIGPHNFTPEHLNELVRRPMLRLQHLTLRFRPYVKKATYYQFLKGSYFDSTLESLAGWSPSSLTTLSITQDALQPEMVPGPSFAQPIVFFRLQPLTLLSTQLPVYFRFSAPTRSVAQFLSSKFNTSTQVMDLTGCRLTKADLVLILSRFVSILHLITSDCWILAEDASAEEWTALGTACALAGVSWAREREKKVKAWIEAQRASASASSSDSNQGGTGSRAKKGRKGLATATISLRNPSTASTSSAATADIPSAPPIDRVRVLPVLPSIKSLCFPRFSLDEGEIRTQFIEGWARGLTQTTALRERLQSANQRPDTWIMRPDYSDTVEDALGGLQRVESTESFDPLTMHDFPPPMLCFGQLEDRAEPHVGCGHEAAARFV
jgi:hypothetical protein